MKSDWQTETENRQMQQSVTLALAFRDEVDGLMSVILPFAGVSGAPPRALSCLSAFVLSRQLLRSYG